MLLHALFTIAAMTAPPVDVSHCAFTDRAVLEIPQPGWAALDVAFTNGAAQPITAITFAVSNDAGRLATVVDRGSFAPGARIAHKIQTDEELARVPGDMACAPAAITYADGSTWVDPAVHVDPAASLAQTPGSNVRMSTCYASFGLKGAPNEVRETFRNTDSRVATRIEIGYVVNGGIVSRFTNEGKYSPGIDIVSSWTAGNAAVPSEILPRRCVVLSVAYANGPAWKDLAPPPTAHGAPPFDDDPATTAPVTMTHCRASHVEGRYSAEVGFAYINDAKLVATRVDFGLVENGGIVGIFSNAGSFAPGIEIRHTSYLDDSLSYTSPSCVPLRVRYADGSVWNRPLTP